MRIPIFTKTTLDLVKVLFPIMLIIAAIFFVGLLLDSSDRQAVDIAIDNATVHKQETYTELYFTHPDSLSKTYDTGQDVPIYFSISNRENRYIDYRYVVQQVDGKSGMAVQLTQGSAAIQKDSTQNIKTNIRLNGVDERVKIVVQLIDIDQYIAFWVTRNG